MDLNTQPIQKQNLVKSGDTLVVKKVFPTIQGEGPFAGWPSVFVRLAGCNLQCPFCDTDYTVENEENATIDVTTLIENHILPLLGGWENPLVVITGGEPFRQNFAKLANELVDLDIGVQVETNGTLFIPDLPYSDSNFNIVCSPKAGKINKHLEPHICAYKYVLQAGAIDSDGLPLRALGHSCSPRVARPSLHITELTRPLVYVQAMDEQDADRNQQHLQATIDACMNHGHLFCYQTHKAIGLE